MQEASIPGFLRMILIIMLVYYGIKFIGRYILPIFLKKMVNNFESKIKQQQGYQSPPEQAKEGETVIDKKPPLQKESNKKVGEYIDYEEVDD